ncbi:hypothetical protein U9M48_034950 [Paspalum notatum var. saurae]|uniref:No apical meristem-associated C-terminal domain-containing protein n=1 Tax=Paspalum notatum var. saurae TaxID=547442 RepID=A0AAQ3UA71_PASNO
MASAGGEASPSRTDGGRQPSSRRCGREECVDRSASTQPRLVPLRPRHCGKTKIRRCSKLLEARRPHLLRLRESPTDMDNIWNNNTGAFGLNNIWNNTGAFDLNDDSDMDNIWNNTGAFDLNDDSACQKAKLELLKEQILLQREQAVLRQKQLALHEAKFKRKVFQNEQRIMDIDLSTLSGGTQKYYAMLQDRILARLAREKDKGPSA